MIGCSGLAYARYRQDNAQRAGNVKQTTGMACIYDCFYKKSANWNRIVQAFGRFGEHRPGAVVAALVRMDCSE
jgi:hypothetical protein